MKSEEKIKSELMSIHDATIETACGLLRKYEYDIQDYLLHFVASICDVDAQDIFSVHDKIYISQVRWFFWHAYRYMTNETYEKISVITKKRFGYEVTPSGIGISINKMAGLISSESLWTKRWIVVRRIIKMHNETDISANKTDEAHRQLVKMIVTHPSNVELKIETKKE